MTAPVMCLRCDGVLTIHDNDWAEPPVWSWQCYGCGLYSREWPTRAQALTDAGRRAFDATTLRSACRRGALIGAGVGVVIFVAAIIRCVL